MRRAALQALAVGASAGMFLVLVMGATVTNTGSAEGCGRSWPLCNGQFVPEFTVATAIEYSHRAVTGVEGVLVLALCIGMLTLGRDREVWLIGGSMLGTLVLQAGLGAAAVLAPQSPVILATHFGISLAAFAATYLATVVVFERTGRIDPHPPDPPLPVPGRGRRKSKLPPALAELAVAAYLLVVVYLGAYVRHAGISLACPDWPLCNGQLVPALDGATGFVFAHRLAALAALGLLLWLSVRTRHPVAHLAVALAVLQSISGAVVVWTRLDLFSALAHAAIVALLFAAVAHVVRVSLLSRERNDFAINGYPPSDGAARRLQPAVSASTPPHVLATTSSSVGEHPGRGAVADNGRG